MTRSQNKMKPLDKLNIHAFAPVALLSFQATAEKLYKASRSLNITWGKKKEKKWISGSPRRKSLSKLSTLSAGTTKAYTLEIYHPSHRIKPTSNGLDLRFG